MGSHSVTCHPAEVTFQPLPQPKLVLDLATPEGCKTEHVRHKSNVIFFQIVNTQTALKVYDATATVAVRALFLSVSFVWLAIL